MSRSPLRPSPSSPRTPVELRAGVALAGLLAAAAFAPGARAQPTFPPVPVPPGNPITVAKTNLGKVLFWDEQLSSTRSMACGTCHLPGTGGSDPASQLASAASLHPGFDGLFGTADDVRGSPGVPSSLSNGLYSSNAVFGVGRQVTNRKTPSMINAAFSPLLFWDGRAGGSFADPLTGVTVLATNAALESQAAGPPVSDVEMAHSGRDWVDVAARVAASVPLELSPSIPAPLSSWIAGRSYPALFQEAFGTASVTPARIAMAIATYQRTLVSDDAPVDQPQIPGQPPPLPPLQMMGRNVFQGPGRCVLCHGGPLFTDQQFHNIGVRPIFEDLGRGAITGNPADGGRFKTPGLRNVGLRAPYFHDGSKATLADVVEFYDRGGDFHVNQDPLIVPLGLTPQQKNALVAFLGGALTDPRVAAELPPFDRPALFSETPGRVPVTYGPANAGSGGATPRWVAVEPPVTGNPNLTIGMDRGLGGALALLGLDVQRAVPGTNVGGVPLHLALGPIARFFPFPLLGSGPGQGWISFQSAIPEDPVLDGVSIDLQLLIQDPAATGNYSSTSGLEITFFAP